MVPFPRNPPEFGFQIQRSQLGDHLNESFPTILIHDWLAFLVLPPVLDPSIIVLGNAFDKLLAAACQDSGLKELVVTGIADYFKSDGSRAKAREMASHADTRYDGALRPACGRGVAR